MTASAKTVSALLLDWYAAHARRLPWRVGPGDPPPTDAAWPYRVWLSEVMLQQTTVAAVIPRFARFTARWPTVEALAAAPEADVMAAWAGLGYYSRARNLVRAARQVAERGEFPSTERELRELPGLGPYTAAAIAAIAFGQRAVVVDANIERVIARLFALAQALPAARGRICELAGQVTPEERAGDFAQAMMDLGAQVCTAREPRCAACPLAQICAGARGGDPARYPVKPARKPKPERRGRAYWIERTGCAGREVWLVRRPGRGMLGGMRALPDDGWSARGDGSALPPLAGEWTPLGTVRHVFTHAVLHLELLRHEGGGAPAGEGEWWPFARIDEAGLPSLFARAAQLVLALENTAAQAQAHDRDQADDQAEIAPATAG